MECNIADLTWCALLIVAHYVFQRWLHQYFSHAFPTKWHWEMAFMFPPFLWEVGSMFPPLELQWIFEGCWPMKCGGFNIAWFMRVEDKRLMWLLPGSLSSDTYLGSPDLICKKSTYPKPLLWSDYMEVLHDVREKRSRLPSCSSSYLGVFTVQAPVTWVKKQAFHDFSFHPKLPQLVFGKME